MNILDSIPFTQSLSEEELVNIDGGTPKPQGVFQWIGYYAHVVYDAVHDTAQGGGSGAYHDAMSSSNHGGIR